MNIINNRLFNETNKILKTLIDKDIVTIPRLNINHFIDIISFNYNHIKLVVFDKEPFNRPDSSGLSCFKKEDGIILPDNFYHKRVKELFGDNFSIKNLKFYQEQGILFLNQSFTTSPDKSLDHTIFWESCINLIFEQFKKQKNPPIIISLGGNKTLSKLDSFFTNKINLLDILSKGYVLEHIPLDKTLIINLGDIQDPFSKQFDLLTSRYDIKDIINTTLKNRKIKKINYEI